MSTSLKTQRPGGRASLKTPLPSEEQNPDKPWEHPTVRREVMHQFNLRLSEPLYLKLRHISKHTHLSMQEICMPVVEKEIEARIAEMEKEEKIKARAEAAKARRQARTKNK